MAGSKFDALVRSYLGALDVHALAIEALPGGRPARITFDPSQKFDLIRTFWFARRAHAELVLFRCRDDYDAVGAMRPDDWIDAPASDVVDTIGATAWRLGAEWRSEEQIAAQASRAVTEILDHVETSRRTGKLAAVNAAYKAYRKSMIAEGARAISYSAHLHAFTVSLVELAARNANAN